MWINVGVVFDSVYVSKEEDAQQDSVGKQIIRNHNDSRKMGQSDVRRKSMSNNYNIVISRKARFNSRNGKRSIIISG